MPDSNCNEYSLVPQDDGSDTEAPPPNCVKITPTYSSPLPLFLSSSPPPPLSSSIPFSIPSSWSFNKRIDWRTFCLDRNLPIPVDYFGDSVICRAVFDALDQLEFPGDEVLELLSDVRINEMRMSPREHGKRYLDRSRSGTVVKVLSRSNNRCRHWLTNAPRPIRRGSRFGVYPIAEADIPSSYMTHLASQMANSVLIFA